jgi:hypothetical protein
MMKTFLGNALKVKARVVCWNQTPCLIASFQASEPPIVWQMDLDKLTSYTLKLVEKDGEWDLGYTLPNGEFNAVAHFEILPDAQAAYHAVRGALMNSKPPRVTGGGLPILGTHPVRNLILLMLLMLAVYVSGRGVSFQSAPQNNAQVESPGNVAQEAGNVLKEIPTGVPVDADDVLPKIVD